MKDLRTKYFFFIGWTNYAYLIFFCERLIDAVSSDAHTKTFTTSALLLLNVENMGWRALGLPLGEAYGGGSCCVSSYRLLALIWGYQRVCFCWQNSKSPAGNLSWGSAQQMRGDTLERGKRCEENKDRIGK